MNQLKHLKQYQSSGDGPPMNRNNELDKEGKAKGQEQFASGKTDGTENDEFIDLSNIQNISDLNQLTHIQKEAQANSGTDNLQTTPVDYQGSPIDVDNIAVDLDEDELEQMQRIIGQQMNYQPGHHRGEPIDGKERESEEGEEGEYNVEMPLSNFSESGDKIPTDTQELNNHHNAIQNELRQLLAQSSSEQLLMMNDGEHANMNLTESEEQELRRRWLHENGLYSKEQSEVVSPKQKTGEMEQLVAAQFKLQENRSIELGEQPLDNMNKDLLNEQFEPELRPSQSADIRQHSNSPPLVTSKVSSLNESSLISQNQSASDLQNLLSSPQYNQNADLKDFKKHSPEVKKTGKLDVLDDAKPMGSPPDKVTSKAKDFGEKPIDQSHGEGDENDSFHRLYNKEIKVNQDEIPLLLLELTDIAYKFIKKDQFEKAYVLLQKTESVLEVVNLEHSKRDKYFAYITYLNMAMCFQKLGMLEECIIYLKETIQVIEKPNFFKDVSISQRMKQMHMQCQLKLQLCAILSQTQKHTEAMDNAKTSVRLAHQILRDMYDLCVFYSNKIKFKDDFASLSLLLMENSEEDQLMSKAKDQNQSNYYQDGLGQDKSQADKPPKHTKSEINEKFNQKQFIRENSPVRDIPYNILEESISMIERTALKLLPIMKELGNRLAGSNGKKGLQAFHTLTGNVDSVDTRNISDQRALMQEHLKSKKTTNEKGMLIDQSEETDIKDVELEIKDYNDKEKAEKRKAEDQIDMRTVLGFLNQNEWILNLNIGNIMQIQPVRMRDFLTFNRNEHQLSRESFLEKLQLLVVSYFCVSTELRFIIQSRSGFMKSEVKKEKELEQEYWHVKALDIACAFLPSECPLFNHILLSYQKHHDPTMAPIEEDKEAEDNLVVLRPLKGIENSKYQPIVREVNSVYIDIAEIPLSPLSKCFDHRLMPRKVKTTSMNIQTDPIEEPPLPMMKSQSISIQHDLKEKETHKESQTQHTEDVFDANNAYMDLSSSKHQENLISKIMDDPKIDKNMFLTKLMTRVNSEHGDKFMAHNNRSQQHLNPNSYIDRTVTGANSTLSDHPISGFDDAIYGQGRHSVKPSKASKHGLLANKTKNTQSNQLSYKKGGKQNQSNFEDLHGGSFDQKSYGVKNHVRSMYGDVNSSVDDKNALGGAKHHIASQSLAPTQTVLADQKIRGKNREFKHRDVSHKKNQSISGAGSSSHTDVLTQVKIKPGKQTMDISTAHRHFNNSVTSNLSRGTRMTNKKKNESRIQQEGIKIAGTSKILKGSDGKINLANQKNSTKKPQKYLNNTSQPNKGSRERENKTNKNRVQGGKNKSTLINQITNAKNEDSLCKELGDVMSSSSSQYCSSPMSGADPDLLNQLHLSQPEHDSHSISELNKTKQSIQSATEKAPQVKQNDIHQQMSQTHEAPHRINPNQTSGNATVPGKTRPSSAITNYTSGQSALRTKMNLKRVQELASKKVQQSQNIIKHNKQMRQKQSEGNPIVPKKKSKVLSRKKYGSDNSSNSPPHAAVQHSYSIAQGPFSIFDSNQSHSISKFSNIQQSKQSISAMQEQQINQYMLQQAQTETGRFNNSKQTPGSGLKQPAHHANSQTFQVKLQNEARKHKPKKEEGAQNQSENILSKLQNLLVNKRSEPDIPRAKDKKLTKQQHSLQQVGYDLTHSNPRKQAHSIGSLGYSQTRQSRYSQNSKSKHGSHSRKSRLSRSKSSGKSTGKAHKSISNDRSQAHLVNKSNQEMHISPLINQSQSYLDSDLEARNQASFELNYLLNEMNKHQQSAPEGQKRRKNAQALGKQRPKSTLQFEHQRESMMKGTQQKSRVNKHAAPNGIKAQLNRSLENLQRQVLENQKILINNHMSAVQKSTSQSKRGTKGQHHNHNNSISLMENQGMLNQNLLLVDESKYSTVNNYSKSGAPLSSTSQAKKKMQSKKKGESKQSRLYNQNQYNTSHVGNQQQNLLPPTMAKQKSGNLSLKMTQQHISNGFKQFANMMEQRGIGSTTASTTGAQNFQSGKSLKSRKTLNSHKRKASQTQSIVKNNGQFVNFEQMQQQLEGGVTLGGVDLQREQNRLAMAAAQQNLGQMNIEQFTDQNMNFVPHKNLMPKTTGSQAHLLNIQQLQQEAASSVTNGLSGCVSGQMKSLNHSMNQTGRTTSSFNRPINRKQKPAQMLS